MGAIPGSPVYFLLPQNIKANQIHQLTSTSCHQTHTSTTINGCFSLCIAQKRLHACATKENSDLLYYYLKLSITSRRYINPVICFLKVRVLQRHVNLFICCSLIYLYPLLCHTIVSRPHVHCRCHLPPTLERIALLLLRLLLLLLL